MKQISMFEEKTSNDVKVVDISGYGKLYFCPHCKKGHQVKMYIEECDICHNELNWDKVKNNG